MKCDRRPFSKNSFRNGFTLIELIVSIMIIALVIISIFTFYLFQSKTYARSVDKSQLQSELRLTSDYVSNKLRNASTISLTDSTLANRFYLTGKSLYLNDILLSDSVDDILFSINPIGEKYSLDFSISGSRKNNINFSVSSNVMLNNAHVNGATLSNNTIVYYDDVAPITPEGGAEAPEEPDPSITPPPSPVLDDELVIVYQPKLQYIKKNTEKTFSITTIVDHSYSKALDDPDYKISFSYASNDPSYTWVYKDNTATSITLTPPNKSDIELTITYRITNIKTGQYNVFVDSFKTSTATITEA